MPFLLTAIATVLALRIPRLNPWRIEILAIASLVFVVQISDSLSDVVCLLAMAATGWALAKAVSRHKSGALLAFAVLCVVAEFVCTRQILPQIGAVSVGRTIGLSYVMFRVIHIVVDAHGNELPPRLRMRDYICYLFCYLTFLAGPIQRVQDFAEAMRHPPRADWRQASVASIPAIVTGTLKFTVIATAFFACFTWSQNTAANAPAAALHAIGWLSFAAYLYASFSGYTDVMRGIGGLLDLDLPANFDRPSAAANFLDFWSRWHITLSEWFKLYVFNPLVKTLISHTRPGLVPHVGAVGYFVTFFLMGLWHGISPRFMLYGVCLGAGVSLNKIYQYRLLRRVGRSRVNALTRQPVYAAAARVLAVSFFIIALGFLWIPTEPLTPAALGSWIGAVPLVVLAVTTFGYITGRVGAVALAPNPNLRTALYAAQLAVVLAYLMLFDGPVAPLLYEYF